ncbi:MAG: transcriptional regulator [Acidaminococcaceae bacterium]
MEPIRIGDKLINRNKIHKQIDAMLDLRMQGFSQQEVAKAYATDRAFVSRVESLGEIRKGGRVALVAFPISNKTEILTLAAQEGIEFSIVFNDKERWAFLRDKNGVQLFNEIMTIIAKLRESDIVIVAASNMRINLAEAIIDKHVIGITMGESPIEEDKYLEPQIIKNIMQKIKKVP